MVEDDAAVLRLVETLLLQDFTVFTARTAEEGMEILAREKLHAVLSDHMLPGMSGVELLLASSRQQPHAARILMTASGRVEDAQEAINRAKVRRFLAKPFRKEELLSTVGEAVHEAAITEIKERLVQELKARAQTLTQALTVSEKQNGSLSAQLASTREELEGVALRDPLTGLSNHRFLQEALTAELARARRRKKPLGVILFDVQKFRHYNRARGFNEGDALLRSLGALFSEIAEDPQTPVELAARYGPDQFALLAPGAAKADLWPLAHAIEERSRTVEPAAPLRAALAAFPEDGTSEESLLSIAEDRL